MIPLRTIVAKSFALIIAFLLSVTPTIHTEKPPITNIPADLTGHHNTTSPDIPKNEPTTTAQEDDDDESIVRKITNITVLGNNHIPTDAILARIPYKIGGVF